MMGIKTLIGSISDTSVHFSEVPREVGAFLDYTSGIVHNNYLLSKGAVYDWRDNRIVFRWMRRDNEEVSFFGDRYLVFCKYNQVMIRDIVENEICATYKLENVLPVCGLQPHLTFLGGEKVLVQRYKSQNGYVNSVLSLQTNEITNIELNLNNCMCFNMNKMLLYADGQMVNLKRYEVC
jgi:hypothetical protein